MQGMYPNACAISPAPYEMLKVFCLGNSVLRDQVMLDIEPGSPAYK